MRTLLLWAAFFCSLFVFYLLTSWLPTILKDAGYDIAHASRIERWCRSAAPWAPS